MKVSEITIRNLTEYLKLDFDSLTEQELAELLTFLDSAKSFLSSYTGLNADEIDNHKDFVIAVYVLVADMYDNRQFYVDKSNLNRLVEMILSMHSTNLL